MLMPNIVFFLFIWQYFHFIYYNFLLIMIIEILKLLELLNLKLKLKSKCYLSYKNKIYNKFLKLISNYI